MSAAGGEATAKAAPGTSVLGALGIEGCVRLPVRVDAERIAAELAELPDATWSRKDRNPYTNADVRSFYAIGHQRGPVVRHRDDQAPLSTLPALRRLVRDDLPGTPRRVIVARLAAGGLIPRHTDADAFFRDTLRLSICITADEGVWTYCGGSWYALRPGEVWVIDNLAPHAVVNRGRRPRIQVVADREPDEALLDLVRRGEGGLGAVDPAAERRLILRTGARRIRHALKAKGARWLGGSDAAE